MRVACLFLLAFVIIQIYGAKLGLYGIITDFGGANTETIVYTVQINPTTGQWIRIVKNFIYVGGSGTYDGISGYDSDKDVLYYATDFATPFLYSSDLKNQVLLPPIDLGLKAVLTIDYDKSLKRLLVYGMLPNGLGLMTYSTSGGASGLLSVLTEYTSIAATAVNSMAQLFYVVGTNSSSPNLGIIDLNNPSQLKSNFPMKCNFTFPYGIELNTLYYDELDNKLFCIAVSNSPSLKYWVAEVGISNGNCVAYPIDTGIFGIATAFTYDQITKVMWFGFAPNGPGRLYGYDTKAHKVVSNFEFGDTVLEDLQVTYI